VAMVQVRLPEFSLTQSAHFVRQALTAFAMQNPCSKIDCSFETGLAGWGGGIRTSASRNQICSTSSRLNGF
jgi:hypothetical protein